MYPAKLANKIQIVNFTGLISGGQPYGFEWKQGLCPFSGLVVGHQSNSCLTLDRYYIIPLLVGRQAQCRHL